jgi:hypothetical protein
MFRNRQDLEIFLQGKNRHPNITIILIGNISEAFSYRGGVAGIKKKCHALADRKTI